MPAPNHWTLLLGLGLGLGCGQKDSDDDDDDDDGGGGGWDLGTDTGVHGDGGGTDGGGTDGGGTDGGGTDGGGTDGGGGDGGGTDGGGADGGGGDGGSGDLGRLALELDRLDFGAVDVGADRCEGLELRNTGGANLRLLEATSSSAAFFVEGLALPLTLGPGGLATATVCFSPAAVRAYSGTITFDADTNDPTLEVSGEGLDDCAGCEPDIMVTYAKAEVDSLTMVSLLGLADYATLTLRNDGDADLEILEVRLDNDTAGGWFDHDWTGSTTLAPGDEAELTLSYVCEDVFCADAPSGSRDTNILHIESDDPDTPDWTVSLYGG
ncbi:choice-of-anchor D domain-containing protein [Myxococcota bacterium]|nr:choice-of-anchor D domain-containing protein [Myxococcota bacterium]